MQNSIHGLTPIRRHRIQRRICRRQEHVLLHSKLGQTIILLANLPRMSNAPHQFRHMPIILVPASPGKDFRPVIKPLLRLLAHQPLDFRGRAAHAGIEHHDDPPRVLQQPGLLRIRQRRLAQERTVPDARVGPVHEEEVDPALVRWELARRGGIHSRVDQLRGGSLQIVGINPVPGSHDAKFQGRVAADSVLDHLLAHDEFAISAFAFELALVVDARAAANDGVGARGVDGGAEGDGGLAGVFKVLRVAFGFVQEVRVPVVMVDAGLGEAFGENFHLLEFEGEADVHD